MGAETIPAQLPLFERWVEGLGYVRWLIRHDRSQHPANAEFDEAVQLQRVRRPPQENYCIIVTRSAARPSRA